MMVRFRLGVQIRIKSARGKITCLRVKPVSKRGKVPVEIYRISHRSEAKLAQVAEAYGGSTRLPGAT